MRSNSIIPGDKVQVLKGSIFAIPEGTVGQVLKVLGDSCSLVELEKTFSYWDNSLGESFYGRLVLLPNKFLKVQLHEVNWVKELEEAVQYLQEELEHTQGQLLASEELRAKQFCMIEQLTETLAQQELLIKALKKGAVQ